MKRSTKERPMFAQDGRPLNRAARRALVAMDKRFRKNKARRGDEFAARRLGEQAEQLKARADVLGAPRLTFAERLRAARDAAVTADDVESLPPASNDVTAMDAPVDVVALGGKAPAPGDAEPEASVTRDFPMPGVRARGLRALAHGGRT